MVSLLFQVKDLDFSPLDHFECFSGEMSVTRGEWNESWLLIYLQAFVPKTWGDQSKASPQPTHASHASKQEGREAMPFDLRHDGERMDLSTSQGFANAMWSVARLRPGSGHLTAPVCSTFVFVCLAQT